jgi:hypothetical protein
MIRTAHEVALADWVELVLQPLGYDPVIFSDQGGTHAIPPYATVRVISDVQQGDPEERTKDAGGGLTTHRYLVRQEGSVEVQVIGGNHYSAAQRLILSPREAGPRALIEAAGLAIRGAAGGIIQLGTDTDGQVNNRSVIEFEFGYINSVDVTDTEAVAEITTSETWT